jgi:alcohol dehydrogenase (NADP+)
VLRHNLANHKPEDVRPALERSLKSLGLDYLNLWLMHYPAATDPDDREGEITVLDIPYTATWKAMEECVKFGLVRNIGISSTSHAPLYDS